MTNRMEEKQKRLEDEKFKEGCDLVKQMLFFIGENPTRNGLKDTPSRVIKTWTNELFTGYKFRDEDVKKMLTEFDADGYDEMIVQKNIEFTSFCVAGSTFVETPKGRIPISRLEDGEFIYCWDEDANRMTIARAFNPRITGKNKRLYRVYTDKDTLLCTWNHKILTLEKGWVKAKFLKPGDTIISLNKGAIVQNGIRCTIGWPTAKKYAMEHKFIYSEINGSIKKGEHIHHINRKKNDNSSENLTKLTGNKHIRLHRMEDGPTGFALFTDAQRMAMRKKQIEGINRSQTEEVRRKRSIAVKAYWDSLTPKERAIRNHKVLLVEKTGWREDVWCMDVPGYENFVANGMVVHNCEHHWLQFTGVAHVGYIPGKKIVGISKLARLIEIYSRRLQIQERLTLQPVTALMKHIQPIGAGCIIVAKHSCMICRGVGKQHSETVTSVVQGEFRKSEKMKNEFFRLAGI